MKAAVIQDNYTLACDSLSTPSLPDGGALVKLLGCGLCGSDLDKIVNQKAPSGSILGHEVTGIIQEIHPDYDGLLKAGDRITTSHHTPCGTCHYCLNNSQSMCRTFKQSNLKPGGFSEIIALTNAHLNNTVFKVPSNISDASASAVEPLACVLRAVERGGAFTNGTVAIIGLGFIGQMAAQVYQNRGDTVIGCDIDLDRLATASKEQFVSHAFNSKDTDAETMLSTSELNEGVDLVFLSVVNPNTLELAKQLIRDGGNIVLFTSSQTPNTTIDPNDLYFREINLITSYSPSLTNLSDAAGMIFSGSVNVEPLTTHTLPLEKIQDAIELYKSGQAIKVFITAE